MTTNKGKKPSRKRKPKPPPQPRATRKNVWAAAEKDFERLAEITTMLGTEKLAPETRDMLIVELGLATERSGYSFLQLRDSDLNPRQLVKGYIFHTKTPEEVRTLVKQSELKVKRRARRLAAKKAAEREARESSPKRKPKSRASKKDDDQG